MWMFRFNLLVLLYSVLEATVNKSGRKTFARLFILGFSSNPLEF